MRKRKDPVYYVDNQKLYQAICDYKQSIKDAEANNLPEPRLPEYIGDCIIKIGRGYSTLNQFRGYPFLEDMISDGNENCCRYLKNFDTVKYSNPHAYITQIFFFAFIQRIKKEKRELVAKHKVLRNEYLFGILEESQSGSAAASTDLDNVYMSQLVEEFDKKQAEKKTSKKKSSEA